MMHAEPGKNKGNGHTKQFGTSLGVALHQNGVKFSTGRIATPEETRLLGRYYALQELQRTFVITKPSEETRLIVEEMVKCAVEKLGHEPPTAAIQRDELEIKERGIVLDFTQALTDVAADIATIEERFAAQRREARDARLKKLAHGLLIGAVIAIVSIPALIFWGRRA